MSRIIVWSSVLVCILISVVNGQDQQDGGIVTRRLDDNTCRDPEGRVGSCINIRKCPEFLDMLRSGRQGTREFLQKAVCGYEGFDPRVCCPDKRASIVTVPVTPDPLESRTETPEPSFRCGYSNASHPRVVNGIEAQPGAWPWLAALGYRSRDGRRVNFLCGGALISKRHVLTAGHCVFNRRDLEVVRLGEHDLSAENDGARDYKLARRVWHPSYSPTSFQNDIAVITLNEDAAFEPNKILPICLPTAPKMRTMDFVRKEPFVAGWGAIRFNGPSSSLLQEVQLPVTTQARCKDAFANFKTTVIDERVMCAGYLAGGKDACQGDSGGPLMWPQGDDEYYVIGIVSYGFRCAEQGYPGVYTRVTYFLEWIQEQMKTS